MVSVKASRSYRGGGGNWLNKGTAGNAPPSRFLVTFLLTAFVLLTALVPLLRFWIYDDSHFFTPLIVIEDNQKHHPVQTSDAMETNSRASATSDANDQFSWDDELKKADAYLRSFRDLKRSLIFFHIPKTAGTAIEYAAGKEKIPWGSCRFRHKPKRDICNYPQRGEEWPQYVGWWHVPAQLFPVVGSNPYQNAELFGVIRDPYDRMVSEFYYICTLKVIPGWRPDQCNRTQLTDPVYMNAWLQEKIQHRETDSGRAYLIDNGHFTPQYDFIFGPHNVRMLDYVLRMDDAPQFAQQFEQLMAAYELPQVQLQKLNALGAAARTNDHLTVEHLDDTTIQWIHNMYPEDFALGRYARK